MEKPTTSDFHKNIWIRFADEENKTPDYLFKLLRKGGGDSFKKIKIIEGLYSKDSLYPGEIMEGDLKSQCRRIKNEEYIIYKFTGCYKFLEGKWKC